MRLLRNGSDPKSVNACCLARPAVQCMNTLISEVMSIKFIIPAPDRAPQPGCSHITHITRVPD